MGLGIMSGNSGREPGPGDPNPQVFRIVDLRDVQGWTVAVVHYPGCETYEGLKLLVYAASPARVRAEVVLDPHFLQRDDRLSPVARFAPTDEGLRMAEWLCRMPREAQPDASS